MFTSIITKSLSTIKSTISFLLFNSGSVVEATIYPLLSLIVNILFLFTGTTLLSSMTLLLAVSSTLVYFYLATVVHMTTSGLQTVSFKLGLCWGPATQDTCLKLSILYSLLVLPLILPSSYVPGTEKTK